METVICSDARIIMETLVSLYVTRIDGNICIFIECQLANFLHQRQYLTVLCQFHILN